MISSIINYASQKDIASIIYTLISLAAILLLCLPVHEFSHAYMAYRLGDNTAKYQGRLTLNPFRHLDLFGALMMLIAGVGYAKPVPVNPLNFRNRKQGMALTALAGPLSNLAMGFIGVLLYALSFRILIWTQTIVAYGGEFYYANDSLITMIICGIPSVFSIIAMINFHLAFFNLIPIPPLDGSRILGFFLSERANMTLARYERQIGLAFIIIVFFSTRTNIDVLFPITWISDKMFGGLEFVFFKLLGIG